MIEAGQLRRWVPSLRLTAMGIEGGFFVVLEHSPHARLGDRVDDGWIIMESGDEPYWELSSYIEKYSELCNPGGGVV